MTSVVFESSSASCHCPQTKRATPPASALDIVLRGPPLRPSNPAVSNKDYIFSVLRTLIVTIVATRYRLDSSHSASHLRHTFSDTYSQISTAVALPTNDSLDYRQLPVMHRTYSMRQTRAPTASQIQVSLSSQSREKHHFGWTLT